MIDFGTGRVLPRRRTSPVRARRVQPRLENLEQRQLLYAASGSAFVNPIRVTYSLIPDGTSIGGTPSSLFSTMNGYATTASWEAAIAKAAAAWEGANVNLVQVADEGSAIGSGSDQQGAPNFGDIRIGAMPLPSGELAFAFLPPPDNGGSNAGDIFFNSNVNWGSGGYDLQTVATHEIGHSLGLDHSTLTSAVMYASYTGVKQSLTSDDASGMKAVYGPRSAGSNSSSSTAAAIALNTVAQATVTGVQVASATDQDWYSVVVPADTSGTLKVTMQSTDLSSLEPRLTIYNGSVQGLAQASTTTLGGTATVTINGVSAGQKYYIRAAANTSGVGSSGAYAVQVNLGTSTMAAVAPPNTTVAAQASQGSATATETSGGGGGGLLGGLLGGLGGLVGGLLGTLTDLLDGGEHNVQVGSTSGWAEALQATPRASLHYRPGHPHPHGPGHKPPTVSVVTRNFGYVHH